MTTSRLTIAALPVSLLLAACGGSKSETVGVGIELELGTPGTWASSFVGSHPVVANAFPINGGTPVSAQSATLGVGMIAADGSTVSLGTATSGTVTISSSGSAMSGRLAEC